nr:LysR substrate-binding domain-containing protein [Bradyrhizobium elkanii]
MDRFEAIRTLIAAVDGGSLTAASKALHLPLPTASRRVSDLEAFVGSQLVVRTTRKLLLTESGTAFLASARRALEELSEAERAASGEYRAPRGELLVTAPIMFGSQIVAPIVHQFLAAYPDVTVRLVLSDGVIDLVDAQIEVAVRIGSLPDSALVGRRVGDIWWPVCASPEYLRRHGEPRAPADLSHHACIAFEGLQRYREWPFRGPRAVQQITINPRFSVNTADGVIGGAVGGLGIARVMCYQAAASVREGALVPICGSTSRGAFLYTSCTPRNRSTSRSNCGRFSTSSLRVFRRNCARSLEFSNENRLSNDRGHILQSIAASDFRRRGVAKSRKRRVLIGIWPRAAWTMLTGAGSGSYRLRTTRSRPACIESATW